MRRRRRRGGRFYTGLLIYIGVLTFALLVLVYLLWTKLERYEITEEQKEREQRAKIEKIAEERKLTVTPTPTPTPTPVPILMETIKIVMPTDMKFYIDGQEYSDVVWAPDEDKETFANLLAVTAQYPEYEGALDGLIPSRKSTVVTIEKGKTIMFLDRDGTFLAPDESTTEIEVDGQQRRIRMLTCPYYNDMSEYEELTKYGFEFLLKFCLFCSNDKSATEMKPYFPKNSKYYNVIASLDNSWFNGHNKPPTYTNKTVREYVGYGDSLVYMDLMMHQSFVASWTGQQFDTDVNHPLWLVKMNGEWKVASIIFNSQNQADQD
ncbi:MAG: hypothetical protein J5643_10390 [Lachnospiraceae bacterium]|nr:hypothetical protein [Lachnospiraceae bacterium]